MYRYKNGNYTVTMLSDGTKIRRTDDDEFIPEFSECCDVKLTDNCKIGCAYCYEGCTPLGKHGDLFKYPFIYHLHPYTELAVNGNDMNHPQLDKFLCLLKDQKVFANITVNQKQFIENYDMLKLLQADNKIHGIGVSLVKADEEFIAKIKSLKNVVIHTINGILSENDIMYMENKDLKILILGYKDLQRGVSYHKANSDEVSKNMQYLYDNLKDMISKFNVVSFDNLSIKQLDVKRIVPANEWDEFYMGDDGNHTFYIDMVKGEFAQNSLAEKRYPIGDMSIDDMFHFIRSNKIANDNVPDEIATAI